MDLKNVQRYVQTNLPFNGLLKKLGRFGKKIVFISNRIDFEELTQDPNIVSFNFSSFSIECPKIWGLMCVLPNFCFDRKTRLVKYLF